MIQENSVVETERIEDVFLIGMYNYEKRVFGIQIERNIIMELDRLKKKFVYYDCIPDVPLWKKNFHRVKVVGKKAYFVPFEYNWLYIYDFEMKSYKKIQINLTQSKMIEEKGLFYEIVILGDEVILLPFTYRGIIYINLITEEQYEIDIEKDFSNESDSILFRKYVWIDDNKILIPSLSSNKLMVFDTQSHSYRCIKVGDDTIKLGAICRNENELYIICKNFLKIWEADLELKEFKLLNCIEELKCEKDERLTYFDPEVAEIYNGKLFLFPARWSHALNIDLRMKQVHIISSMEKYCSDENLNRNHSIINGGTTNGRYLYLHYQLNKVLCFDMETEEIIEYFRQFEDKNNILFENFLNKVKNNKPNILNTNEKTIYNFVK